MPIYISNRARLTIVVDFNIFQNIKTLNSFDVKKNENISKSKPKHKKRRKEDVSNIKRISPELLDALREVQRAYKKFKKLMKLERQKHSNQVFRCSFISDEVLQLDIEGLH